MLTELLQRGRLELMKQVAFKLLLGILLLVQGLTGMAAQIVASNPGIPDYERVEYQESTDGKKQLTVHVLNRKNEGGKDFLELRSSSVDGESTYRVDPITLLSYYSDITSKSPDATIRRTSEILSAKPKLKAQDMAVSDLGILGLTLRGFPFESKKFANLVFLGASSMGSSGFSFELKLQGKETIKTATGSMECYKLEMGLSGFLGTFVSPTKLWFSTKSPYIMVRSEGVQGPPGSPVKIMELISYTTVRS